MPETDYFDRYYAISQAETPKDKVIDTKDKCIKKGYNEYNQHHFMVTTTMDVTFGVAKKLPQ